MKRHPNAKLKISDVRRIRRLGAEGMTQKEIASLYFVTQGCINGILHRDTWKHVKDKTPFIAAVRAKAYKRRFYG